VLIGKYHGAVRDEIVDAHKRDFEVRDDGIIFHIRLDNRGEDIGLKTEFRARRFPLHSAIVADVRAYLDTIPDGPAFPQVAINERFGSRSHNAGGYLDKFIKKTCGINRRGVSMHTFRHTVKSAMRGAHPESKDNRDYLTGHAPDSESDKYGKVPSPKSHRRELAR
jgi:integrase